MISICPACVKSLEHDDNQSVLKCTDCGHTFNPQLMEQNFSSEIPSPMEIPTIEEPFQESTAAFQELRDFGENLPPAGMPMPSEKKESKDSSVSLIVSSTSPALGKIKGMVSCIVMLENSLDKAIEQLCSQAKKLEANSIYGLNVTGLGNGKEVLVFGTAMETTQS